MPNLLVPLLLPLLAGGVTISSQSSCPSAIQVRDRLQYIAPRDQDAAQSAEDREVILKQGADGGLTLSLRDAAIGTISHKRLPPRPSCEKQADIAATVIAAWLLELYTTAPALVIAPAPEPVIAPRRPAPRPFRYELSLGLGGSYSGADFAPAGFIEGAVALRGSPLLARFALLGIGQHTLALGTGQGRWARGAARLGIAARLLPGPWTLELAAEGLLALLHVSGEGFARDGSALGVDGGLSGGVRAGRSIGSLRLFIDVSVVSWLRRNQLVVHGSSPIFLDLPRIEGVFSVGASYARGIPARNDRRP